MYQKSGSSTFTATAITTIQELQRFHRLGHFYKRFIRDPSILTSWWWRDPKSSECLQLHLRFTSVFILKHPELTKPFMLEVWRKIQSSSAFFSRMLFPEVTGSTWLWHWSQKEGIMIHILQHALLARSCWQSSDYWPGLIREHTKYSFTPFIRRLYPERLGPCGPCGPCSGAQQW